MKVLITTGLYPPEIGGPATHTKYLEEGLPGDGIAVEVLAFRRVRKYWPLVRHFVFFLLVLKYGRKANVLYAQDTVSVGIPTMCANFFLRKKFAVRVPGDHAWEQGTRRFGITESLEQFPRFSSSWHPFLTVMRWFQMRVVRSADALIVPSRYMQKIVLNSWNVDKKKVHVVYNGVEELGNTGNKPVLRGLLKFQGKLLISVGRLVPWKGFGKLIELLPDLKKEFPDLKLLIAGSGSLLPELEAKAGGLNVADDVIFTGQLERDVLIRYIRLADVFVLNSKYEGLSHQLLEVMAIGVPVIVSKIGGNPEVVEHGKNGYLVSVDDGKQIGAYVSGLLKDATLRAKITAAAKRTAKQFSNERMVEGTVKILRGL